MNKLLTLSVIAMSSFTLAACASGNNASNKSNVRSSKRESVSDKKQDSESSSKESSNQNSSSKPESISTSVNKSEILSGDYNSLDGTWTNSHGYKLVFQGGKITANVGNGNQTFSLANPTDSQNIVFVAFTPAPQPDGMSIMIVTKGTEVDSGSGDGTITSKDRIVMGNNGGATLFASKDNGGASDTAYYRSN